MSRKLSVVRVCPFCQGNCFTYDDAEFTVTKRHTKQYFHRSCYEKYIEDQKKLREESRHE